MEVVERVDELFGQAFFVVLETLFSRAERGLLDVLDLEFYCLSWDGGEADVKVGLHLI